MQYYKESAIKYEKYFNNIKEQVKDIKSFLRVAICFAEINENFDKQVAYEELLQYMNKYL